MGNGGRGQPTRWKALMVKKASKEYAQALGNVILRERNRRGWSATELGRRVGVSRACVSSWELAISSPTWFNLVNLAAIMRLPLSNLMRRVELEMDKDNDASA